VAEIVSAYPACHAEDQIWQKSGNFIIRAAEPGWSELHAWWCDSEYGLWLVLSVIGTMVIAGA
jgi:hypothetical protein